jgi:HEAT repeat protein
MKARRSSRRTSRNRKSGAPLSSLRTSEVVRTIVDHPRRLDELVSLIEDSDLRVRDRAAATLARLAESHPGRLLRVLDRLTEVLADDSAYVRWNLAFALGSIGARFPGRLPNLLARLTECLDDENQVVRVIACRSLLRIASRHPKPVFSHLEASKRQLPVSLQRLLRSGR